MDTLQKAGIRGIILFLLPIILGFGVTLFGIKAAEEGFALGFLLYGFHSILFGVTFVGQKARGYAAKLRYDSIFWSGWPARLAGVVFVIIGVFGFLRSGTALVMGDYNPDTPLLKISLNLGTNPNSATLQGVSPLMVVSSRSGSWGGTDAIRLLLEKGANPNTKDTLGRTPLMNVSTPECVALLIQARADVNARDHLGRTALMYFYDPECVALLIRSGANVNARDNEGQTALKHARGRLSYNPSNTSYGETVKVLERAGAIG